MTQILDQQSREEMHRGATGEYLGQSNRGEMSVLEFSGRQYQ